MIKQMKKHRKLFAVMLVLAMVFSFFGMVAPPTAEAGQINMLKFTWQHEDDPEHPEDVYLIGQEVHYQLEIENEHTTNSMEIEITDIDPSGNVWYWNGAEFVDTDPGYIETIAPLSVWEFDFHYFVEEDALFPHETLDWIAIRNELAADGMQGPENIDASVTKTSRVVQPDISVTKEADRDVSKAGSTVTYTIEIENTGDWNLEGITVDDSLLGDISDAFPDTLEPGEIVSEDFTYDVEEGDDDPLLNEVDVSGTAEGFDPAIDGAVVTDSADAEVAIVSPAIEITKEADRETSKVGSAVTYTIGIENTGDIALENIVVDDSLLGDISADFPDTLDVGASFDEDFDYTIQEADVEDGKVVNEVRVDANPEGMDNEVWAEADAEVAIVSPAIEITKEADKETSKVGSTVTYTIGIENTGDIALENITVDDSLLGDLSGDFPDTLAVDESFSGDFPYVVDADDVEDGKVVNEVRVDANPEGMDNEIWDEASFEVSIVSPAIELTKSVNPDTAQVGDTVTYTICIENIGDWDLENIVVNDTLLGGPLAGFPDTLAVGADSVCVDFDYVIQEGDVVDGEVVNTADVYANPVGMDNDITDDDYAVVTIEEMEVVCETAWAYGNIENNSLAGTGNAWGWTNGPLEPGHYEYDLFTGAAQNDPEKGELVGTVTVHIEGEDSWVEYELFDEDCWFSELHLWVGDTELPETRRGYTAAPGQFNYSAYPDANEYTFNFDVTELSDVYVAAHAVVCCYEVMEE